MNGNKLIGGGPVSAQSWAELGKPIGTGDFNDDGFSDILFQNASSGQVSIWEMHGNTLDGRRAREPQSRAELARRSEPTAAVPTSFFKTPDGQASIWDMSGTSLVGGGSISPNPGPSWQAVGMGGTGSSGFDIGNNPKV